MAERAGVEVTEGDAHEEIEAEGGTIESLRERTEDWTEDIVERDAVEQAPDDPEPESEAEQKEAEQLQNFLAKYGYCGHGLGHSESS